MSSISMQPDRVEDAGSVSSSTAPDGAAPGPSGPAVDEDRAAAARIFTRFDFVVYAFYVLAAGGVVARVWLHVGSRTLAANPMDHQQALWFLAHGARVVTGGHNPLFTRQLNAPDGVNLMANTSMLGLGVPMTPVTVLFGPRVTFALLLTLGLAGTAAAWYVVFRRSVVNRRVAAAVAGGFCGFAPGLISHGGGQLNFVAQFLLPFVVLSVLRLGQPGHGVRRSVTLGLLVAYQAFINEELLLLTAAGCAVLVIAYASLRWSEARLVAARFVRRLAGAAVLASLLLAYPLWFQFFGPGHYRGLPFDPNRYQADVWSYVAYSGESLAGSVTGAARYSTSATEENSFFGWPAIILCGVLGWWFWRRTLVKAALITAVVFVVLSFGRTIIVSGTDTGVPGPFRLVGHLPLGEMLVSTRFALVVVPVLGLLLALGADRALALPWRDLSGTPVRAVWLAAFAAALVPIIPTPISVKELAPAPAFVANGVWREYVAPGRSVVAVPLATNRTMVGQVWSAETRTEMAIPSGYFLGPTSESDAQGIWGPPPRPTALLLNSVASTGRVHILTEADRLAMLDDLRYWRASVVVVGERTPGVDQLRATLEQLLGPGTRRDGVWLWDVRTVVGAG